MNSLFIYRTDIGTHHNVLACYISGTGFDLPQFKSAIKSAFEKSPFSKKIVIISAEYNKKPILDSLLENKDEKDTLKKSINYYQPMDLYLLSIDKLGRITCDSSTENSDDLDFDIRRNSSDILQLGLIDIIKRNNLILESSPTYHFVKPSGKHTNKFIKTSNVLQRGAEISFIAINLIKYTKTKIKRIYTDTAGIFPLAYELISIKRRFNDSECEIVDSFGSYKGLDDYTLPGGDGTLILISATTSDEMANKLKLKPGLASADIISIFSAAPTSLYPSVVKFLDYHTKYKDEAFAHFKSTLEHECEMCIYQKSIPLPLNSTQFVFDAPKAELYLPLAKDSPANLKQLITSYKDLKAFKCLYDGLGGSSNETPEFFINLRELVDNQEYKNKIKNYVTRHFPLNADLIVHANDQGAKELAEQIQKNVQDLGKQVDCCAAKDISDDRKPAQGIVVVAGSIQTGKSLLEISRKLRQFSDLPIAYVVGFAKYNDPPSYAKLKADLCHNNGCPHLGRHQFQAIEEILLPTMEHRINSWNREIEVIKQALNLRGLAKDTKNWLEDRDRFLRQASDSTQMGIGDSIFLPSPAGKSMILGKTFAFWNDKDNTVEWPHQATVYFTISSILQGLRYNSSGQATPPLKSSYVLKQLDPLMFDRFNEGVIQASVLRAAKPSELDYSASDDSSRIVGTLIERMLKDPTLNTSEALPEFLLAICSHKIQIKKDHIGYLMDASIDETQYPLTFALLEYAKLIVFGDEDTEAPITDDIPF